MTAEQIAEAIIRHFEGCAYKAYICPSGKPTIGIGHVILPHEQDLLHRQISEAEAEKIFEHDFNYFADVVKHTYIPAKLNDNQIASLISFTLNAGVHNFETSTLLKDIQAGRFDLAAMEFRRWVHGDHIDRKTGQKEVLPGLVARRKVEEEVFKGATIEQMIAAGWYQHK